MRKLLILLTLLMGWNLIQAEQDWKKNFTWGNPEIASINAMSFGPEGILFIGDSRNAMVYAIDTKDNKERKKADEISLERIDQQMAEVLGCEADQIVVQDMVVNPLSKVLYLAVEHAGGTPILMRLIDGEWDWFALDEVSYSQKAIEGAYSAEDKDRRGRPLRVWTVSDLAYADGKVLVSGLSNQEFSSTFKQMPFPFEEAAKDASLEIYHAAHGRYETYAPIKAFTVAHIEGQDQLVAGYTCTPLVLFPMDQLEEGSHQKGRTVAELGNWNTPVDMIVMEKGGESYLLLANTNRAVMKIKFSDLEGFSGDLTEPIAQRGGTEGVPFIAMPWVNVLQLDKLDHDKFVMLKREANGDLNLVTKGDRWL